MSIVLSSKFIKFCLENEASIDQAFDNKRYDVYSSSNITYGFNIINFHDGETTWQFSEPEYKFFKENKQLYNSKLYKALL